MNKITGVQVNGASFGYDETNSDNNFPFTIFHNAFFQININSNTEQNQEYSWSVTSYYDDAISVSDSGVVKFDLPFLQDRYVNLLNKEFTVSAKHKSSGEMLTYKAIPKYLFLGDAGLPFGTTHGNFESSDLTPEILSKTDDSGNPLPRQIGNALFQEWGNLEVYPAITGSAPFSDVRGMVWTNQEFGSSILIYQVSTGKFRKVISSGGDDFGTGAFIGVNK